jgi:hypothetical protein
MEKNIGLIEEMERVILKKKKKPGGRNDDGGGSEDGGMKGEETEREGGTVKGIG